MTIARRRLLQIAWMCLDVVAMATSFALTASLLGRSLTDADYSLGVVALIIAVRLVAMIRLGMYRAVLRFSGLSLAVNLAAAIAVGTMVAVVVTYYLAMPHSGNLGRALLLFEALLSTAICGGTRLLVRLGMEWTAASGERVLIYGAGSLGELALRDLRRNGYSPIGFIDDDPARHGDLIHDRRIHGGGEHLDRFCIQLRPDLLVIAVDDLPPDRLKEAFHVCMTHGLRVKVVKGMAATLVEHETVRLQDLHLEDLLRRPPRTLDAAPVLAMLAGKTVLVTGAGGSIGRELCRQVAAMGAGRLVLVDHSEGSLYQIDADLRDWFPALAIEPVLCNLVHLELVHSLVAKHRPQVIFHAAAYKHVPLVEENPFHAVDNNVRGFRNLIEAADACAVERLVLISTDKAVRPTNIMGSSKRVCELVMENYPARRTRLCAVRFGNVLGSSGSVIPKFMSQIARGGPVTVTHRDMTRYFMLIPEAAELVLQAGAMAEHGEIFILDMGKPVKIHDMARQLIFMSGHVPDRDMAIAFTGLRPGEKLFEELLIESSERPTTVEGILVARSTRIGHEVVTAQVDLLLEASAEHDLEGFVRVLANLVPEWTPGERYRSVLGTSRATRPAVPPPGEARASRPSDGLVRREVPERGLGLGAGA